VLVPTRLRKAYKAALAAACLGTLLAVSPALAAATPPAHSRAATSQVGTVTGPDDEYSCLTHTGVIFWGTYPGHARAYAYINDCHGNPVGPTSCTSDVELQIYDPHLKAWEDDGSGKDVKTCSGSPKNESRVTKKCTDSRTVWAYRAKGTYIVHWEGRTYDYTKYTKEVTKLRLC
jgi:hypothetical protein